MYGNNMNRSDNIGIPPCPLENHSGYLTLTASEVPTVLVVRKKDDRNNKTSHLILKMSMNEAFIWLSGHRFIDREIFNG